MVSRLVAVGGVDLVVGGLVSGCRVGAMVGGVGLVVVGLVVVV